MRECREATCIELVMRLFEFLDHLPFGMVGEGALAVLVVRSLGHFGLDHSGFDHFGLDHFGIEHSSIWRSLGVP